MGWRAFSAVRADAVFAPVSECGALAVSRRSLVAFVVAVAAAAVLTPFAVARAGDRGAEGLPPDAGLSVKGDAKPAAIDMTGGQPAPSSTDQLALDPTTVPG